MTDKNTDKNNEINHPDKISKINNNNLNTDNDDLDNNFDNFMDSVLTYFNIYKKDKSFCNIIKTIDLEESDKKILFRRIIELQETNTKKIKKYNIYTSVLKFIMTVFSIVLTFTISLVSFINWKALYYFNLILLFFITLSTNIYFQYKIGDKYIIYKKSYLKINFEIWSFIMSTGLYINKTHKECLHLFYSNIENIYNTETTEILDIIKKSNGLKQTYDEINFINKNKKNLKNGVNNTNGINNINGINLQKNTNPNMNLQNNSLELLKEQNTNNDGNIIVHANNLIENSCIKIKTITSDENISNDSNDSNNSNNSDNSDNSNCYEYSSIFNINSHE